jgi:hypothetical protein
MSIGATGATLTYSREGQCAAGPRLANFERRNDMKTRLLGKIEVLAVGMGCKGFSHGYGAAAPTSTRPKVVATGITKR